MAVTPYDFFRTIAENSLLLEEVYERGEVTEGELSHLISTFRKSNSPSEASLRRQLLDLDILEPTAHSSTSLEMVGYLRDLFDQLLKRPQMFGAPVLEGYLEELSEAVGALSRLQPTENPWALRRILYTVERTVEKIRHLGLTNQDGVATESQQLRTRKEPMSSTQRFEIVQRLWDKYLIALRSIVDTKGRLETKVKTLPNTLLQVEEAVEAGSIAWTFLGKVRARITRMQASVFLAHTNSVQEILPLYERLRRDSRVAQACAHAINVARVRGIQVLNIDARLGVSVNRSRNIFSTDRLQSRLAEILSYTSKQESVDISNATRQRPSPRIFVTAAEVRRALSAVGGRVDNILTFVVETWPEAPISEILRLSFLLHSGEFGAARRNGDRAKQHLIPGFRITAWPYLLEGDGDEQRG